MKYRIEPVFSLNSRTGAPETNYMVQRRKWGTWNNIQMFIERKQAQIEIDVRRNLRER